jgi:hypothetical protein
MLRKKNAIKRFVELVRGIFCFRGRKSLSPTEGEKTVGNNKLDDTLIDAIKGTKKDIMTIGYLDLLGVGRKILTETPEKVGDIYFQVHIGEMATHQYCGGEQITGEAEKVKSFKFSDSILFIGGGKTPKDVRLTVSIMSGIMGYLAEENIFSRGAISIGEFLINEEFSRYAGKPLVEAVLIESVTDWAGLTVLKPAESKSYLLQELLKYDWLSKFPVPIKSSKKKKLGELGISLDRLASVRWFKLMGKSSAEEFPTKLTIIANSISDKGAAKKLRKTSEFICKSLSEGMI